MSESQRCVTPVEAWISYSWYLSDPRKYLFRPLCWYAVVRIGYSAQALICARLLPSSQLFATAWRMNAPGYINWVVNNKDGHRPTKFSTWNIVYSYSTILRNQGFLPVFSISQVLANRNPSVRYDRYRPPYHKDRMKPRTHTLGYTVLSQIPGKLLLSGWHVSSYYGRF